MKSYEIAFHKKAQKVPWIWLYKPHFSSYHISFVFSIHFPKRIYKGYILPFEIQRNFLFSAACLLDLLNYLQKTVIRLFPLFLYYLWKSPVSSPYCYYCCFLYYESLNLNSFGLFLYNMISKPSHNTIMYPIFCGTHPLYLFPKESRLKTTW